MLGWALIHWIARHPEHSEGSPASKAWCLIRGILHCVQEDVLEFCWFFDEYIF